MSLCTKTLGFVVVQCVYIYIIHTNYGSVVDSEGGVAGQKRRPLEAQAFMPKPEMGPRYLRMGLYNQCLRSFYFELLLLDP